MKGGRSDEEVMRSPSGEGAREGENADQKRTLFRNRAIEQLSHR